MPSSMSPHSLSFVRAMDTELKVIGDTTAMSTPHEIEYTLTFDSTTVVEAAQ